MLEPDILLCMKNELEITAKNNLEEEKEVVEIVKELTEKYNIPLFTNRIQVETKVIPHTHPILTLNTRTRDHVDLLQTLVHEQFHWFAQQNPKYDKAIKYLKKNYEDNRECNITGKYPNSFWEHIIVCFNTRKTLSKLINKKELEHAYTVGHQYMKTEKLVLDKFKQIEKELEEFDMVFSAGDI